MQLTILPQGLIRKFPLLVFQDEQKLQGERPVLQAVSYPEYAPERDQSEIISRPGSLETFL